MYTHVITPTYTFKGTQRHNYVMCDKYNSEHYVSLYLDLLAALSWPLVVLWGLVSSQFFFGFGHHATVVSLRFDAGFVGLHGQMSGLNLLCAGMLVGLNMLGSQVTCASDRHSIRI